MHLGSLTISRFRSCDNVTISLRPDLTVLVGENNGGKSNVIDAIRLLTLPLSGRRERYPEDEDVRRNATVPNFQIEGVFRELGDTLKGLLVSAVPDPTKNEAVFGYRYEARSERAPRGKTTTWAGRFDTNEPEAGSTDLIRHVYLPPLRDAHQALGTGSGTRVMALLRHFLPKDQEQNFLTGVRRAENRPDILTTINTEIGTALGMLTNGVRPQSAALDFGAETLLDVARDLRFRLADSGLAPEDIRASGLGYSNLLYMATVVVELAKAKDADLTIFLVEEPEAHLHPQLQVLVLEFLLDQARQSANRAIEAGKPEGRIQIVVTTHSPNLTAWVSPTHLVVMRSRRRDQDGRAVSESVSVPIAELGLKPKTLDKISRYLDVTRSALLFGDRAILVEGIAEALLLPVLAQKLVLAGDAEGWLRFKGTVIVPIEGVDFRPYVEVLLRPHRDARIADRLIVITDADPTVLGNRRGDLEYLAAAHGAPQALTVLTNQHTLEHEIFSAGNETFLKSVFLRLHRNSRRDWEERIEHVAPQDRPDAFLRLIEAKKTRKGDLAQAIASRLATGEPFVVPDYLADAIRGAARA
ncbi:DNA replication and repair protein RecF [Ralstonia condita]|uniref:DNA replication and repair protein RecF n=1 Tax=Ralstonia condita TaxID=3058600 RepID=A0ABM9JS88_9RALS|nr:MULTISPECIES: AAA family ATPase [Ralstonia]CAJ0802542.1 DNA replication and repair protein RecF [Ralstonia sp. LMG 7141]